MKEEAGQGEERVSREFRTDKQAGFLLTTGFFEGFGAGMTGAYFLSRDSVLELSYVQSTNLFVSSASYAAVRLRRYLGNSVYLIGGLGYRETKYDGFLNDVFDSFGTSISKLGDPNVKEIKTEASATTMGIDLGVGNQWQWGYFTLGCEWLGFYKPLTILKSDATVTTSYEDGSPDTTENVDIPDENYLSVGYHALMLTLGWSW